MTTVKHARKSDKRPPWRKGNKILNFLFVISLILLIWGIDIYRLTVIEAKYLIVACIFGAAAGHLLVGLFVTSSYSRMWNVLLRSLIGASFTYFSILFLNQQFASRSLFRAEFKIIETGSLARGRWARCSQPYVIIDFHGKLKQLIYYCDKEEEIQHSQKVIIQYSKGAFGFAVIESSQLGD